MSKEIPLSRGMSTIVDDDDYEWLSQWKWYAGKSATLFYAVRNVWRNGKIHQVRMHRLVINAPDEIIVDHINRNSLDNRRSNLRLSNCRENQHNSIQYDMQCAANNGSIHYHVERAANDILHATASLRNRHNKWSVTITISNILDKEVAYAIRDKVALAVRHALES